VRKIRLPPHKKFFAVHGKEAETLSDLKEALLTMSENDFKHHTHNKNDFSKWTRDILHRDTLAARLDKTNSREDMIELIADELRKDREYDTDSDEFKRFMVREFLYGFIIGILIGVIIARLI